jgi:hypothetical protein
MSTTTVSISGTNISPSPTARNLGVVFDSDLSFSKHISTICQSSFYHIRQLRQIRPCLNTATAIILANALVSSKLDYCNSLYYNLPNSSIHRLQLVQNSLARVVIPAVKRHHHITPTLRRLHWLPVNLRIKYKIALLTYKTLQNKQPAYLHDLLSPVPLSNRRSSNKNLLQAVGANTNTGKRAFCHCAPSIWNALPLSLRLPQPITSFRSNLKTYLFPP